MEAVLSGIALLAIDQWTKREVAARASGPALLSLPFFTIRLVESSRRRYLTSRSRASMILLWTVAATSATLLYSSGSWFQTAPAAAALGCAFGGAAGNLLDVLRRGSVVDFIDLGWWPVFNVADVAIVAGLFVAFWPAI